MPGMPLERGVVSRFDGGANHKHQTKGNHDVANYTKDNQT